MLEEESAGFCLPSQDIRKKILEGIIQTHMRSSATVAGRLADESVENRIQPASFEPMLGEEIWILRAPPEIFRPEPKKDIYTQLKELPSRYRERRSLLDGFKLDPGKTYLIPQLEFITLQPGEEILMSPKSTSGRAFLHTRMFTDYNEGLNVISNGDRAGVPLQTWLLIEPTHFETIVRTGLTLTQLRFHHGNDAHLSDREILQEYRASLERGTPLIQIMNDHGEMVPAMPKVRQGLQLHLEGKGLATHGVVALTGLHASDPIDLTLKAAYDIERNFEPQLAHQRPRMNPGDHTLCSTAEYIIIPDHLCGEVLTYADEYIEGELDDAAFFDNSFQGQGVAEIRSKERRGTPIKHGHPMTKMLFFRMRETPDKLYGDAGNNYARQMGPRPGKQFKQPRDAEWATMAREYKNIERIVLTVDARHIRSNRRTPGGFELFNEQQVRRLEDLMENPITHFRYDCEKDAEVQQVIPYGLLFGPNETVFIYGRSREPKNFTETRLYDKISIGIGGHATPDDQCRTGENGEPVRARPLAECILRELDEEAEVIGGFTAPRIVGGLDVEHKDVDRVHTGVIYTTHVGQEARCKESALKNGFMISIPELVKEYEMNKHNPEWRERYESWTLELIPHLPFLYRYDGGYVPQGLTMRVSTSARSD